MSGLRLNLQEQVWGYGKSALWGLAVALAVYLSAGISGAHLNPAVTIALALFVGFDKRKVPFYIILKFLVLL